MRLSNFTCGKFWPKAKQDTVRKLRRHPGEAENIKTF
jgi:hypothetical protein